MIRSNFLEDRNAAQQYIEGVKLLKDPASFPWPGQPGLSIYDVFVFWHHQSMMLMTPPNQSARNAAHTGPAFLPWHRYFLLRLELFLQEALADPNFRLPYWDCSADAALPDPSSSEIWNEENLGQFTNDGWRVRLAMNPFTGRIQLVDRPLERTLGGNGRLPTRRQVRTIIRRQMAYDTEPYSGNSQQGVRNHIEGWVGTARIHNNVHVWVGGDMASSSSPNDPTFFLHHCNVDRMWAAWQERHPDSPYQPDMSAPSTLQFHRIDDPLYSIFNEQITPRDMLDYKEYYEYDRLP